MTKPWKTSLTLTAALAIALTANVVALPAGWAKAEAAPAAVSAVQTADSSSDYALYLSDKYGIHFSGTITKGEYIDAAAAVLKLDSPEEAPVFSDLTADSPYYDAAAALYSQGIITSTAVDADAPLSAAGALFIAVKAAGLSELAYTYPDSKTSAALQKLGYESGSFSQSAAQELAAAVDTGLLPASLYSSVKGQAASASLAETLLAGILSFTGEYKHYIGYTDDNDIYIKLLDAYNTADLIEAPELQKIVDAALQQNLVTGYNLKDSRFDSGFVDSLSLTYGHDNSKHAVQLIGLLRSEGIRAKVQLEPKTSAFIYLKEWGEPVQTDSYKVVQIDNGNYIAYAKEYDLAFEFESAADKAKFQDVILQYAKKDSDDEAGLIASSWWQPLYYSLTELDGYTPITNNKIVSDGPYYAQSFSLTENSAAISEGFAKLGATDGSFEVIHYPLWVDEPFYRYLLGDAS